MSIIIYNNVFINDNNNNILVALKLGIIRNRILMKLLFIDQLMNAGLIVVHESLDSRTT